MLLRNRTVKRLGNTQTGWVVDLDFSQNRLEPTEDEPNPLNRPLKAGLRTQFEQRPTFHDPDGAALVNAAGSLYLNQTRDHVLWVYDCAFNLDTPADWLGRVAGSTNSDLVTIHAIPWPANTLRFVDLVRPSETSEENGTEFWPHEFAVIGDPDGWFRLLPNRGFGDDVMFASDAQAMDKISYRCRSESPAAKT